MKKSGTLTFTRVLYVMFPLATVVSLFIVYNDIDSQTAYSFLIGYLLFTLFLLVYIPIIAILNSRKLKSAEIRKKLTRFAILFIFFGILNYVLGYVFRPHETSLLRALSTALAVAFGLVFTDVLFLKKDND